MDYWNVKNIVLATKVRRDCSVRGCNDVILSHRSGKNALGECDETAVPCRPLLKSILEKLARVKSDSARKRCDS